MRDSASGIVVTTPPATMTAAVQHGYGLPHEVIEIGTVPVPRPDAGEVLVRVAASSVNALDWHYLTGTPLIARLEMGLRPRRIVPGSDIAGTVVAIGDGVEDLIVGDQVFGDVGGGGFAQYVCVPANTVTLKPSNLGLVESSTLGVAALTALQGLRDWGRLQPGQRVLINGASGGVGTFAIQMARALGAGHITAICSTRNMETASALGADRVVDYTKSEFTDSTRRFDVFFDNAGSRSLSRSRRLLRDNGVLVMITGRKGRWLRPVDRMIGGVLRSRWWSQSFVSRTAAASREDLRTLRELVESGDLRPVMDRRFALHKAAEALAYQGEGHSRGNSVVLP